ncbi:hypothetical protein SH449x_003444 [Pirellulaceae bacterium SH449]
MRNFMIGYCMVFVAVGWAVAEVLDCPNKAPSNGVGACHEEVTLCTDNVTEYTCLSQFFLSYEVKQDFPRKCVEKEGFRCNQPLKPCYRKAACTWQNGICVEGNPNPALWQNKKKRVGEKCNDDCEESEEA